MLDLDKALVHPKPELLIEVCEERSRLLSLEYGEYGNPPLHAVIAAHINAIATVYTKSE